MRMLEKQFTSNFDKVGDCVFTQIAKHEGKENNIYIYERKRNDKLFSYEVFFSKRRLKGQPLPGGMFEAEDREQYPGAAAFGFTAKETKHIQQAEIFFQEFIDKMENKEDSSMNKKERKVLYPENKNFTMNELVELNPDISRALIYVEVQKDLKSNKIKEIERKKSASGRGKATVVYGKV